MSKTTRRQRLREQMLAEKGFLKSLFDANNCLQKTKDLLSFGSIFQINLVIKICHELSTGNIPLKKDIFHEITRRRKLRILMKGVEKNTDFNNLLISSREDKLTYLYKLCSVLSYILHPLFNKQIHD
jgi:hypothetical protein